MATALPLTNKISRPDFKKSTKARTLTAQFGDGYSQEAPDGVNNKVRTYEVTWIGLTATEKATLETFLETVGGWGRISWTPCYESASLLFKLKDSSWDLTIINNSTFKISCTLQQVFL